MRPIFCADWRVVMLAVASLSVLPLQAQQKDPPVKPGTDATDAVGSKVEQMKPDCAPKTMAGNEQKQQPATDAMNKAVPPMTAQDCMASDAATGTKQPPK
jgi:hypothetical protein